MAVGRLIKYFPAKGTRRRWRKESTDPAATSGKLSLKVGHLNPRQPVTDLHLGLVIKPAAKEHASKFNPARRRAAK